MAKKVAVIGAGIAGLVAVKYSKEADMEVDCYEQTNNIGGTWVYNDEIGLDRNGLKIHSSMYRNLHTNLPKEVMGFQDFPFTGPANSYVNADEVLEFLKQYSRHFDLEKQIKFEHHVTRVSPLEGDKWEVVAKNLNDGTTQTKVYDGIFVCNGHYSVPRYSQIQGLDNFKGKVMHSHDYRYPDPFSGKTVLTIGAGPSGIDITKDLSTHATRVYWSHHLGAPVRNVYSDNVTQKPDVVQVMEDGGIHFYDGTVENVDVILFCTGYQYTFPFLTPECQLKVDDNHVTQLYKHIININHPTMYVIGIPFSTIVTLLMDLQVRFCIKYLSGRKPTPSKETMQQDYESDLYERQMRSLAKRKMHFLGNDRVRKYYTDLAELAEIDHIRPVLIDVYFRSAYLRVNDPKNYRQYNYQIVDDYTFYENR